MAEEAAGNKALSAVVLELRGNPARLDLTATRRLHRRAEQAGRPVFLLRQAAFAEPTAAPVRLLVEPAPAGLRRTLAGPLPRSIGPPAFIVTIGKSRTALPGQFIVEWNADELAFAEREESWRCGFPISAPSGSCGSGWGGRGVQARNRIRRSSSATATGTASA